MKRGDWLRLLTVAVIVLISDGPSFWTGIAVVLVLEVAWHVYVEERDYNADLRSLRKRHPSVEGWIP